MIYSRSNNRQATEAEIKARSICHKDQRSFADPSCFHSISKLVFFFCVLDTTVGPLLGGMCYLCSLAMWTPMKMLEEM